MRSSPPSSAKALSFLDLHFSKLMERLAGVKNTELALAAALASHHTGKGHICLDLAQLAGRPLPHDSGGAVCPPLSRWLKKLEGLSVVGRPGDFAPLILDSTRLYLHRYWTYEKDLAEAILGRLNPYPSLPDAGLLKENLDRLFTRDQGAGIRGQETRETDWQQVAAFAALAKGFCVITGGPGTGKTTTVVKILALLLEQGVAAKGGIALAAPTGKAAARLRESLLAAREALSCPEIVKEALPQEVSTLHRLLGPLPNSPSFRHHAGNPLPFQVVVVDEASQVDLPLMTKLVRALPGDCRLILLGDVHQLSSMEPGAVLGDICGGERSLGFSEAFQRQCRSVFPVGMETAGPAPLPLLADAVVHLRKNYRFPAGSGMDSLAGAVKEGRAEEALKILQSGDSPDVAWKETTGGDPLAVLLEPVILEQYGDYFKAGDIHRAFEILGQFRVLCALREGPFGVAALNELVERILVRAGLLPSLEEWYPGRPVMISRNDYNLNLFNGDIGVIHREGEERRAFFPEAQGGYRKLPPQTLPEHETVFAMTVHKSQGSEFDRALLILPDRPSPVLTRELLYTGLTRARKGVEIWGRTEILRYAVERKVERTSGLRERLWGG